MKTSTFADDIVKNLSHLEKYAGFLTKNRSLADDLVQETILRALMHAHQFRPGTDLGAWLGTILRNLFIAEIRRQNRIEMLDPTILMASEPATEEQEWHQYMREVTCRYTMLSAGLRDAIVLVGVNGYSYGHAAKIAGCAVGTMKSRVSRARSKLRCSLADDEPGAEFPSVDPRLDTVPRLDLRRF